MVRLLHDELPQTHQEGNLKIIRPAVDGLGRLHAQRGLFTWLEDSRHLSLDDYAAAVGKPHAVQRFVLKGKAIIDAALLDLRLHGLDWRVIYPDLEGAALSANTLLERIDIDPT